VKITEFEIKGPLLIELKAFDDERGFFVERYKSAAFAKLGLPTFVQDNFSRSAPDVLRGLHYQFDEPQSKLVTALSGRIYDIAVDIRHKSPTFGQHVGVELDGSKPAWFWVPAGFAHGFVVLDNQPADVMYKVNSFYNAKGENGIVWNDSSLNINWPVAQPLVSPKDALQPSWATYCAKPKF
jgi:dTDP-4-dehydrorhamnose 3,5-epimerase